MQQNTCSIPDCQRLVAVKMRGWCNMHYSRWRMHGDPLVLTYPNGRPKLRCRVSDCSQSVVWKAESLCAKHRYALQKHGDVLWERTTIRTVVVCCRCGENKPANEICRHPTGINGIGTICKDCKSKYDAEYRELRREQRRESNRRRKAVMFGAHAEIIDMDLLWEKGQGVCDLCPELIDRFLSYPDPMSPSQDHIIPISRGGTHTMDNLRITHWICNIRRGIARGEEFELQTR